MPKRRARQVLTIKPVHSDIVSVILGKLVRVWPEEHYKLIWFSHKEFTRLSADTDLRRYLLCRYVTSGGGRLSLVGELEFRSFRGYHGNFGSTGGEFGIVEKFCYCARVTMNPSSLPETDQLPSRFLGSNVPIAVKHLDSIIKYLFLWSIRNNSVVCFTYLLNKYGIELSIYEVDWPFEIAACFVIYITVNLIGGKFIFNIWPSRPLPLVVYPELADKYASLLETNSRYGMTSLPDFIKIVSVYLKQHRLTDLHKMDVVSKLWVGQVLDTINVSSLIKQSQPDEIYLMITWRHYTFTDCLGKLWKRRPKDLKILLDWVSKNNNVSNEEAAEIILEHISHTDKQIGRSVEKICNLLLS